MTYPSDIETKIDFAPLRQYLLDHCYSIFGRDEVDKMHFLTDYSTIINLLAHTNEMLRIAHNASLTFPQGDIYDCREALKRVPVVGTYLSVEDTFALYKTLRYCYDVVTFIRTLPEGEYPCMYGTLTQYSFDFIPPILKHIEGILDAHGVISDKASPMLARIRSEMRTTQNSVSHILTSILKQTISEGLVEKDVQPTLREGRLVIPIPPTYKRKIGGIVHDESATGKTVFLEPQQVVEANNRVRELQSEEKQEEIRILTVLTDKLRGNVQDITALYGFLGTIDFLQAKVSLAIELNAISPVVQREPIIMWRNARHPILFMNYKSSEKVVVPLNITLGSTTDLSSHAKMLVISGPNAGGKSVCLKTVALLQYMLQCGLLVPLHESSTMGVFENLLIDIGDEQSIQDDLSTYSSHLKNMREFLKVADNKSLVLIDEMGGGTDPAIGGAIAEVVLKALTQKNTFGVITTHYSNLKHFAEVTKNVINGAMLYDKSVMKPLFQLSIGVAGSSYALEIAKQIGMPATILDEAVQLVGTDHINYDQYLNDIARDKHYWETKRAEVKEEEKSLQEKITHYDELLKDAKKQQKEILKEARNQADAILAESNATIERTIREIKESQADKVVTQQARQKVEHLYRQVKGTSSTSTGPKQVLRSFGDLKTTIGGESKSKEEKRQFPLPNNLNSSVILATSINFSNSFDMRGMRADEGVNAIMEYIDEAIVVGAKSVSILHGTGTGALKQIVRDYLRNKNTLMRKRSQGTLTFHDGDPNTGGAGITIVEFNYNTR